MGFADFILCPAAVILAVVAAIRKNQNGNIFVILSYLCCSLPAALSLYDVVDRVKQDDTSGILDVYPVMSIVYIVVLGIVTVIHICALIKKGK